VEGWPTLAPFLEAAGENDSARINLSFRIACQADDPLLPCQLRQFSCDSPWIYRTSCGPLRLHPRRCARSRIGQERGFIRECRSRKTHAIPDSKSPRKVPDRPRRKPTLTLHPPHPDPQHKGGRRPGMTRDDPAWRDMRTLSARVTALLVPTRLEPDF